MTAHFASDTPELSVQWYMLTSSLNNLLSFNRYSLGEFDTRFVSTHISLLHIAKYMGSVEREEFGDIEARNVAAVQQCTWLAGPKRIFHYIESKWGDHSIKFTHWPIETHSISLQQILLKGITRTNITLKPISFKAVLSLSIRPLISGNFSENLMSMFLVHILSTPALIYQIEAHVADSLQLFHTHSVLERSLSMLEKEQNMKIITNSMKGTQSLALLANLIHLFHLEPIETATDMGFPTFTVTFQTQIHTFRQQFWLVSVLWQFVCMKLLESIPHSVGPKGGTFSQWHELLGWFSPSPDAPLNENLSLIKKQLYLLWGHRTVKLLLGKTFTLAT